MSDSLKRGLGLWAFAGVLAVLFGMADVAVPQSQKPTAVKPATHATFTVQITHAGFSPATLQIPADVQADITWINTDTVAHTIVGDPPHDKFVTPTLQPGQSTVVAFKPGNDTFKYHDQDFPNRTGSIVFGNGSALKSAAQQSSKAQAQHDP